MSDNTDKTKFQQSLESPDGVDTIYSSDEAAMLLSDLVHELKVEEENAGGASISFEESRNKAIYLLNGEVITNVEGDTGETIPWMNDIVSTKIEKINRTRDLVQLIVRYYVENQDTVLVVEEEEE